MKQTKIDLSVSRKINEIRFNAGGSFRTCCTCGQFVYAPYRRLIDGAIAEGCIDAAHTAFLFECDINGHRKNDVAWHFSDNARKHRKNVLADLRSKSSK